jgi:hypothetical protein
MLLIQRDEVRGVSLSPDYVELTEAQMLALIQGLAYWLMQNGWSDVEAESADKYFESRLSFMTVPPHTDGKRVREFFVERSNLLREPVVGRIDFRHRTFQEFLAAQDAIRSGDIGVLIRQAVDDQWREMIILAAGLARPAECKRLLKGLVARGNSLSRRKSQVHLLALACLETAVEVDPETRELVFTSAARLFPPQAVEDASLFSLAGDPAVPLLAFDRHHPQHMNAACVRTLSMIGSPAALAALEQYPADVLDLETRRELGYAWDNFDRHEYAKRVLQKQSQVLLQNISSLEGAEWRTNVRSLHVSGAPSLSLVELDHLGTTELRGMHLFTIGSTTDLNPVARFTSLEALSLWSGFESVRDLSPLSGLVHLEELALGGFRSLTNIAPIAVLQRLQRLHLNYCSNLRDLSPLRSLSLLSTMRLRNPHPRLDLTPLTQMGMLTDLTITTESVVTNRLVSGLSVTHLSLRLAKASQRALRFLCNCPNLTVLQISVPAIVDLSCLLALNSLEQLHIKDRKHHVVQELARRGVQIHTPDDWRW